MKKLSAWLLALCIPFSAASAGGQQVDPGHDAMNPPIVEVAGGKLRGYMNGGTYAFVGIQYATAARFQMPQKTEPWNDVKDAQTYGPVCPVPEQTQVSRDEFYWPHRYWPASENCHFLNLWTQQLDPDAQRPVMVFLHGGGFTNGSSIEAVAYDGKNLSEFGDVVVVTLNHRLNVLGTLNLTAYGEEFKNAGNTGMADIQMALHWIQENIETFGGNPDNVTIFGQSGGSGKVVHLMHMPSAEGLFHKAIAESSGSAAYLTKDESLRIATLTLENLGLATAQVDVLKTIPYDELLEAADAALDQVRTEVAGSGRDISWRPVLDGEYIQSEYSDFTANMPLMAGTNFSERTSTFHIGDGRKNSWSKEETYANLKERYGARSDEIIAEFNKMFPEKKTADAYFYASEYRTTVRNVLDRRLSSSHGPVYNYLFAYEAPVNGGIMPFHCAELIYVFHNVDMPSLTIATGGVPSAHKVQDTVARAWVNFAQAGDPSQEGLEWAQYTKSGHGTMVFDTESEFKALDDRRLVDLMSR